MSLPPAPPLTPDFLARLAPALGVTRVARVTGLDRAGVEVAVAVRPGGYVLQVCNGKGLDFPAASAGALLETAELWAAETVPAEALLWGSLEGWLSRGRAAWGAEALGTRGGVAFPRLWSSRVRCAWREATELHSGQPVLVPAQGVYCPPTGAPALGPVCVQWTSNGSGAHPERPRALLHALLEATERDQLARLLPEGWTEDVLRSRLLRPEGLEKGAPRTAALARTLGPRGFDVHLFDLSPGAKTSGAVGLPVGGALLVDRDQGPVPLAAGYACALTRDQALLGALLEAAQSRLTDIHGAREDVEPGDVEASLALAAACAEMRPRRDVASMPEPPVSLSSPEDAVREVLRRLAEAGFPRAAAVDLEAPLPGLHVVRVVVPGLRVSELL
ncbi:YcaO-like family protein [Melittangium boletus]|uniref:Fatty acid-binding protein n=1 Tax=Melittangium boletus DSM 14713 TaxID=1294270 RepID=A0A250IKM3_9BACT|nr:YcaO-like family protein [Melittangium boletus]ATB31773.1 fatty acid-binding protein [Melittangium boletus DSM 14713]